MELAAIVEMGGIKDCSNVFEVISKYPKSTQGLLRNIYNFFVARNSSNGQHTFFEPKIH